MLGKRILAVGAVIAGFMLPAQAMAFEAYTRVDLNLRVGPDTNYGVIDVIPFGDPVEVLGCLEQFAWCDVEWYGLRGWVAATYLVQPSNPSIYLPQYAPRIGVPIISFSFGTYHDRYYRDRPWYRERQGRWRGQDYRRGDRPRARQEIREQIREEERRENREEQVEERRETREEQVEERRETREEREQQRRETRQQRQERLQQTEQPQESRKQRQQQRQKTEQRQQRQQRQEADQPQQRQQADKPGERTKKRRQPEKQGRTRGQPEEEVQRQ